MSDGTTQYQRIQTGCLLILTGFAIAAALYLFRSVMIPFVLAVALAIALTPVVQWLHRRCRLPVAVAVGATFLLGFCLLAALGVLVAASFADLSSNADQYQAQMTDLIDRIAAAVPLEKIGLSPEALARPLEALPDGAVGKILVNLMNAVVGLVGQAVVVLIFLLFLLMGGSSLPLDDSVIGQAHASVLRYLGVKFLTSAVTGVLTFIILAALSVPLALVFGLFAFLLNFIPSIGSIVATILPLPVVLFSPGISLTTAVLAIALPGAVQFTIGNLLEPKFMGRQLGLHPITVMLALIFWGVLWGVIGMLLAAPITATVRIILERIDQTRPIALAMAGQWGSTAKEQ